MSKRTADVGGSSEVLSIVEVCKRKEEGDYLIFRCCQHSCIREGFDKVWLVSDAAARSKPTAHSPRCLSSHTGCLVALPLWPGMAQTEESWPGRSSQFCLTSPCHEAVIALRLVTAARRFPVLK